MKKGILLKTGLTAIIFLFLIRFNVLAASIAITSNTNWSAIVTGSGPSGQPSSVDDITVRNGATLTVDVANGACLSIQLGGTAAGLGNGTLTFNAGSQINIFGTVTLGNSTRTGSINMTSGGTLSCQGFVLNTLGTWTPGAGSLVLNDNNTLPASTSFDNFNNLSITNGTTTFGAGTTPTIGGNLFITGTLATNGISFSLNGSNPTVGGNGSITGTGTFTLITGTSFQSSSKLTIAGQISVPSSATVTNNGTITSTSISGITGGNGTSTWVNAATGTLNVAGPLMATGVLTAAASGNTINYNGAAQTVKNVNYYNLFLGGSGTKTLAAGTTTISGAFTLSGTASVTLVVGLTITGNFDIESGASLDVSASNFALNIGGNWTNNGGAFNPRAGTVTFNSAFSSFQYILGNTATTFWSVTVNNVSGYGVSMSGSVGATINGVLTLTSGRFILGNNNLILSSTGSLGGTFASTHMIVPEGTGTFTRIFPNSVTTFTFPVGNASGTAFYSPVTISTAANFNGLTLTIRLKTDLDPDQSPYLTNYIKRYWVLSVGAGSVPTYNITCNYSTGDVIGDESKIQNAKFTLGSWTYSGFVNTSTHVVSFTGLATLSDFTGADPYGVKAIAVPNPICPGGSSTVTANVTGGVSPYTYKWSTSPTSSSIFVTPGSTSTYTVTVTDNSSITRVSSVTLTVGPITISKSVTNNSCFCCSNGAVNITVSGGAYPLTYHWSNGATTQNISELTKGTYSVTVTDIGGCLSTTSATITQPPDPTLTADQTICIGGSVQLTATGGTLYQWSPTTGLSSTTIANPIASPTVTTTYTVQIFTPTLESVVNGNFSQGNVGFTTDYIYVPPGGSLVPEGTYAIAPSPRPYHASFWGVHDHTTGSGNYMIVNGATNTVKVWEQNVTVIPGALYYYSTWINSQNDILPAALRFTINGIKIGPVIFAPPDTNHWIQFYAIWNSGINTNAQIQIIDTVTIAGGNDFGLDDISFAEMCSVTKQVTVYVSHMQTTILPTHIKCRNVNDGSVALTVTGGIGTYGFKWSNGATTQNIGGLSAGTYSVTVTDNANASCKVTAFTTVTQPALALSMASSVTHLTCNGVNTGAINITVSGGVTGYFYNWSNGSTTRNIPGLSAASYAVTVTDANSCTITGSWSITQPNPIIVSTSSTPVTCFNGNNGTTTVSASGGGGGFIYKWNNGQTTVTAIGLSAGSYTVTITDNRTCTKTANATVDGPPGSLNAAAGMTKAVTCKSGTDGIAEVTASGGWSSYTYKWNIGQTNATANGLSAATYTVTVTDLLGCTKTATATVSEPALQLSATASQTRVVTCKGGSDGIAAVTATGGWGGYTYKWNNGQTNATADDLSAATYMVTVTDLLGCTKTATATVSEPAMPLSATAGQTKVVTCQGGSDGAAAVTATGGLGGYIYKWNNSQTNATANGLSAAIYTVTVTDVLGCTVTATTTVSEPQAMLSATAGQTKPVSCNGGTDGTATVTATGGWGNYQYYWNNGQTTAMADGLSAGGYTVTVTDLLGCTITASATLTEPTMLSLQFLVINVACFNSSSGAVSVTASGGMPAYSYSWSTGATTQGITGLSAGNYTVTVTDARSCTISGSATVTSGSNFDVTICGPDTVCQGQTVQYCLCEQVTIPGVMYQWTIIGGTIVCCPNDPCVYVKWDNCNIGQICLILSSTDPLYQVCTVTVCKPVVVKPTPQPNITGPLIVNVGETATYCTPAEPGDDYNWSVLGGSVTSGQGTNCLTVTWNTNCSSCQGMLIVNEIRNGCCGIDTLYVTILPGTGNLTGYVTYKNVYNTGLNGVSLVLRDTLATVLGTALTGPNPVTNDPGYYSFSNLGNGKYHIGGSFNGTWGGNNATDALIIELHTAHILSLAGLNLKVGDVNADLAINSTDALWVKLRTVGMIVYYPAGDWKIEDSTFTLTGSASINLNALCEGDVNGSFIPSGFKDVPYISQVDDGTMTVPVGESFDYDIRSNRDAMLGAMTMFLGYDRSRFEIEKVVTELDGMKYLIKDGKLSLAWSNTIPMVVNTGEPVITLRMKVKESLNSPTKVFEIRGGSEFAGTRAERFDNFDLRMPDLKTYGMDNKFSLGNYPNPFNNTTTIVYHIPEQAHVKLVLMNMFGEVLQTLVDAGQAAGSYQLKVNPLDYNLLPGVYLYGIEVDGTDNTFNKINKMVFTR